MAGTKEGGRKAAITNKQRYGEGFYKGIGAAGGRKSTGGAFKYDRELASRAGRKGGMASRRPKNIDRLYKERTASYGD